MLINLNKKGEDRMRKNKLREIIKSGETSVGARVLSPWPGFVEVIGNTGVIDYIEFVGEYSPWDLHDLENIGRAYWSRH